MLRWLSKKTIALFKIKMFAFVLGAASLYIATNTPQMYNTYLREYVGNKVFKVLGTRSGQGGGTGFAVKAKSGKTVIVSNAHVCEVKDQLGLVKLIDNKGKTYIRKVLLLSSWTDLCFIDSSGIDIEGLSLGKEPSLGDIVSSVGHPSLHPLTVNKGEIIGREDVDIFDGILGLKNGFDYFLKLPVIADTECMLPKHQRRMIPTSITDKITIYFAACFVVIKQAYITSIHVQPGNSGSPVVDHWGRVVGVVFSKDEYHWGQLVSFDDLSVFLSTL